MLLLCHKVLGELRLQPRGFTQEFFCLFVYSNKQTTKDDFSNNFQYRSPLTLQEQRPWNIPPAGLKVWRMDFDKLETGTYKVPTNILFTPLLPGVLL